MRKSLKSWTFFSPVILLTMILSCNTSTKNTGIKITDWKIAGTLPNNIDGTRSLGLAGPVAGISHDRLIVGGGSNFPDGFPWDGGKKEYHSKIDVFKKENDSLIALDKTFQLPYHVAYSANCTTDMGIVAAGGENEKGAVNKVLLLNWNEKENNLKIHYLPDLPEPLTSGAIAMHNYKLYFAGGQNSDLVSDKLFMLNLKDTAAGWMVLTHLPEPVTHTVLYAQSDGKRPCLYIVGGRKSNKDATSELYKKVYQFNLKTKQWSQKSALPYTLSAFTGVSRGDSSLLVFSGDEGRTFHATEVLIMKIAREKDPDKKKVLIAEKNELQKNHPGYNGNVLLYNTLTNKWKKIDSIPFPGQVTTTALKWDNDIVIPCGEIRAGVRTPEIVLGIVSE